MTATAHTTTRRLWIATYRAFRIAHNQTSIMAENGITVRMQAVRDMRDFTGKWDMPRPLWASGFSMLRSRNERYKPTLAFRRFLKKIA